MNIGVVLAGGLAKGAYQVGALKALEEFIPMEHIKCISCASIGALNGYAYATGKLDKAEDMWRGICGDDEKIFVGKFVRSERLQQIITDLASPDDQPNCKMYTALLNINTMKIIYSDMNSNRQHTRRRLRAAIALPFFNPAVKIDDCHYYDGAIVDNIPVYPLMQHKLDYIICIYFDNYWYTFEDRYFDNKIIKIFFPDNTMAKNSLMISADGVNEMITAGYEHTRGTLLRVFENGIEDLEFINKTISKLNDENPKKQLRLTVDTCITGLNKISKKIAKIQKPQ